MLVFFYHGNNLLAILWYISDPSDLIEVIANSCLYIILYFLAVGTSIVLFHKTPFFLKKNISKKSFNTTGLEPAPLPLAALLLIVPSTSVFSLTVPLVKWLANLTFPYQIIFNPVLSPGPWRRINFTAMYHVVPDWRQACHLSHC